MALALACLAKLPQDARLQANNHTYQALQRREAMQMVPKACRMRQRRQQNPLRHGRVRCAPRLWRRAHRRSRLARLRPSV